MVKKPFIRNIAFSLTIVLGILVYFSPLKALIKLSFHSELYSHFLMIPGVSAFLLFLSRRRIFSEITWAPLGGTCLAAAGLASYLIGLRWHSRLGQNDFLFFCTLGAVAWINGASLAFYGPRAFRRAMFPLLFLFFMVPIPRIILNPTIHYLQMGSVYAVDGIFRMLGMPHYRHGTVIEFTGVSIEVAKQCSGIRSTLALVFTSLLTGYFVLQSCWRRTLLVLAIFPVTVLKNAVRIATLTLLALYVDKTWLTDSWLHQSGGFVFFLLALLMLAPLLWWLKKSETQSHQPENDPCPAAPSVPLT